MGRATFGTLGNAVPASLAIAVRVVWAAALSFLLGIGVSEVLTAVDTLCTSGGVDGAHRSVAALAAWFHDAVYAVEPAAANEAESASLEAQQLGRLGVDPELTARVVAVVLDTASHALSADALTDPARVVVHDADLWVLAAPVERFDEYCAQVREEYAVVPEERFRTGRSAVLTGFARRARIYRTDHAHREWTARARANLRAELEDLSRAV